VLQFNQVFIGGIEVLSVFVVRQYCFPSIMYGSEIWYINVNNQRSLHIACNDAFWKIFMGSDESRAWSHFCFTEELLIIFLANLNKLLFWKKLVVFDNPIVRWLATRRKDNMYALACKLTIDFAL